MRKLSVHMQTTLDNRIATADGTFWEPFPWGEPEMAYVNTFYASADTWAMSRPIYEAVVPWWTLVANGQVPDDVPAVSAADQEFAGMLAAMTKVVFSRTLDGDEDRVVMSGDLVPQLEALKAADGREIILSGGPATLGPLLDHPGLVDELLLVLHPAVITTGPRLFDGVRSDLALELVEAKVFDAGAVVLRHRLLPS